MREGQEWKIAREEREKWAGMEDRKGGT